MIISPLGGLYFAYIKINAYILKDAIEINNPEISEWEEGKVNHPFTFLLAFLPVGGYQPWQGWACISSNNLCLCSE